MGSEVCELLSLSETPFNVPLVEWETGTNLLDTTATRFLPHTESVCGFQRKIRKHSLTKHKKGPPNAFCPEAFETNIKARSDLHRRLFYIFFSPLPTLTLLALLGNTGQLKRNWERVQLLVITGTESFLLSPIVNKAFENHFRACPRRWATG